MKKFSNATLTLLTALLVAGGSGGAALAVVPSSLYAGLETASRDGASGAVGATGSPAPVRNVVVDANGRATVSTSKAAEGKLDPKAGESIPSLAAPGPNAPREYSWLGDDDEDSDDGPFKFNGYLNGGYFGNTLGADSNGDVSAGSERGGAFNGAYIGVVKETDTSENGIDWGGGVDFMFGEDSKWLRVADGLDETWTTGHNRAGDATYGFALPQAYADLAVGKWVGTFGRFYTPLGYESSRADERFFYSTGVADYALPTTHVGARLRYDGFERFTPRVSFVNGADQGFSDEIGGKLVVADFELNPTDALSFVYVAAAGNFEDYLDDVGVRQKMFGSAHSWTATWNANDRWTFVGEATYVPTTYYDGDEGGKSESTAFGQHTTFKLNDAWKLGTRVEWFRTKPDDPNDEGDERFDVTLGANWSPGGWEHLRIRPEIRYDSSDVPLYGQNGDKRDQTCLGVDALASF